MDLAGDDHKALRKIAAALLVKAVGGDLAAINALADRTDGKVARALIGDNEQDAGAGSPHNYSQDCRSINRVQGT